MVRRGNRTSHPRPVKRAAHLERTPSRPVVAIVGLGRLGTALARGLAEKGWPVEVWTRSPTRRRIPGVKIRTGPLPNLERARLVLLTVPDRAIEQVATGLARHGLLRRGQVVAHCSGSLDLTPLAAAATAGAEVGSLHPLVAAAPGPVELAGKAAAIDGSEKAMRLLRRIARTLGLEPIVVPASGRRTYHAAASLAANGLVALAEQATNLLASVGLTREQALRALLPLLRSSLDNLAAVGLPAALTGPIARGDAAVVEAHLEELRDRPHLDTYRALSARMVELARQQGSADPEGLERIVRLLARRPRRR